MENVSVALATGRSIMVITGHISNWESLTNILYREKVTPSDGNFHTSTRVHCPEGGCDYPACI